MSSRIKNLELMFESRPQLIAHQRLLKTDETKGKPQDLNFWKIYSKVPRTNSLKPEEQKKQDSFNLEEEERLIVISAIKNPEKPISQSPSKQIRAHRPQIKRYISDNGINFTWKINKLQQTVKKDEDKSPAQNPIDNQSQQFSQTDHPTLIEQKQKLVEVSYKRSMFSGNKSDMKTKYRIVKDTSKKSKVDMGTVSKTKLPELRQQKKYPVLMKNPQELKEVKSESYILVEYPSERIIVSNKALVSLEIASLTKIMTFYTIMAIVEERTINIKEEIVTVTAEVNNITGTSAELIQGDQYTIQDLLYGLMLPSGNDAANQLAYWAGCLLTNNNNDPKILLKTFVNEMNRYARLLDLRYSKFANPHGLPHQQARSTASDIAKLCCTCMKRQLFRTIVSCKLYRTTVKNGITMRQIQWQNTNKLLRRDGFIGLKTGITVTAGPCLAAAYNFRDKTYISVILRAPKVSGRFKETRMLLHWSLNKLYKQLNDSQRKALKKLKKHNRDLDSDYSQDEHQFRYNCEDSDEYKRRAKILNYQI